MLKNKSMDSFLREATVLKSVNFIKASGNTRPLYYYNLGYPQMIMSAYNDDICILVEELLGINLETLTKQHNKLTFATVASIGIQLVTFKDFKLTRIVKPFRKPTFMWIYSQRYKAAEHSVR